MSQISQLSKLAISVTVCITTGIPHTTSPVPQKPNVLLADTLVIKACFYRFFLHQTQSKREGNIREKAWRTPLTLSPVGSVPMFPGSYVPQVLCSPGPMFPEP